MDSVSEILKKKVQVPIIITLQCMTVRKWRATRLFLAILRPRNEVPWMEGMRRSRYSLPIVLCVFLQITIAFIIHLKASVTIIGLTK
jgi:hypothetical protein